MEYFVAAIIALLLIGIMFYSYENSTRQEWISFKKPLNRFKWHEPTELLAVDDIREKYAVSAESFAERNAKLQIPEVNRIIKAASKNGNNCVTYYVRAPEDTSFNTHVAITKNLINKLKDRGYGAEQNQSCLLSIDISW